ncbi:MAG: RNA polymerase sigma factor [Peptococcaceae bacterium]|nr:RNA polymerase sigma factor [Peptococcaceae bacterium]
MQDNELVERIQCGDQSALNEIIRTYYNEIYHFLCRKLSDTNAAQDVTQTVFLKFVRNIHSYHERGKLKNYLFRLAANAGNDYFRNKPAAYVLLDACFDRQSDDPLPEEAAEKREAAEAVKNALLELPIFQRDVIILRFYHGLPFKDIARIMDCGVSSTKSRYRQGMEKLKILLERAYDNE